MCQIWRPCAAAKPPAGRRRCGRVGVETSSKRPASLRRCDWTTAVSITSTRPTALPATTSAWDRAAAGQVRWAPWRGDRGGEGRLAQHGAVPAGRVTGRGGLAFRLQEEPRPRSRYPVGSPLPGLLSCGAARCDETMRGGQVGPQAFPRHARRPGAGGWAGRMASLRSPGSQADRQAPRPSARRDPLVHPVAITEHCVIGDQIRVPAAWCDMAGCVSRFADPAALGESDNRARALVAGWGEDGLGRLVCSACQQRDRQPAAREMMVLEPTAAPVRTPAGGPARSPGAVSQSVRSMLARWRRAVSRGRHCGTQWSHVLLALASGSNGWTAPQRVTVPDDGKAPDTAGSPAAGVSAAHHTAPGRPAEPARASAAGPAPLAGPSGPR
jgi:hypothetical protein